MNILQKIAAYLKPQDSHEENFNLAVADYLSKGLREKGLQCTKKNAIVEIKLDKPYLDKYSAVIIDCLDGNLYLRGKNYRDKKWGKLRRFEGQRTADALHCANQSITRIFNRIKSLQDDTKEVYAEEQLQRECYRTDKRKIKIAWRTDERISIGFLHNGRLLAKAADCRHKWIIGQNEFTTNQINNKICDILKEVNSCTVELSYNIKLEIEDGYYIVTLHGGLNGNGDWRDYLSAIKQIFDSINEQLGHIWLIDLKNDCIDDVWDLRFGVQPSPNYVNI